MDPALAERLESVIFEPDSDAHRLAFADAVEPSDPERAELVRLQVELTRRRRKNLDDDELVSRERQLLARRGDVWAGAIRERVRSFRFYRGFVEEISLDAQTFLGRALELYRLAPVLHLNLSDVAPVVAALFASPALDRLRSLSLSRNALGDAGARALAASPHLGRLVWLSLAVNEIGQAGLEAIAASPNLPSLRYLDLRSNDVADPTPEIAGVDGISGVISSIEVPAAGRSLIERFGSKAWLAPLPVAYPPARDALY